MKLSLFVLFLVLTGQKVLAQDAFQTIDIAVGGDAVVAGNSILENWSPTRRGSLELRTPYYSGELEAGARYVQYNEKSFEDSGFRSVYLFLGWHYPLSITDRLSVSPGFRIGTNFLTQDNKRLYFGGTAGDPFIFHEDESIFAYELMLRSGLALTDHTALTVSLSYNRSALQIPFSLTYLSAGISRTFNMPGWLQGVVK